WRSYDVLQPDPLYQTGLYIEHGGFALDLPNGKYHVFVNIDSPSGFWGEYQRYRKRTLKANGVPVVQDTMDLARFQAKYFRFAAVSTSTTTSSASCPMAARTARASSPSLRRPPPNRQRATPSSPATGWRTFPSTPCHVAKR